MAANFTKYDEFKKTLTSIINVYGIDADLDTYDFLLAELMVSQLLAVKNLKEAHHQLENR